MLYVYIKKFVFYLRVSKFSDYHRYGTGKQACSLWNMHTVLLRLILVWLKNEVRADTRFAASQWETSLLCNDVSHWLGASL